MEEKEPKVKVDFKTEGNVCIVYIIGELTLLDAPDIGVALDKFLNTGINKFLFDFDRLTFIDSSGVSILIRFYGKLIKAKGFLAFTSFHKNVANTMQRALPAHIRSAIYFEQRKDGLAYLNLQ